jgi:hypothetical protein
MNSIEDLLDGLSKERKAILRPILLRYQVLVLSTPEPVLGNMEEIIKDLRDNNFYDHL